MQTPHDHLFQQVFAEPEHARGLLRAVVPAEIAANVHWHTLTELSATLFDAELSVRRADVVHAARRDDHDSEAVFVIEHKSEPRRFAVLQMHRYVQRIWDRLLAADPERRNLPATIAIVVHHHSRPWNAPTTLAELLAPSFPLQPSFEVLLLDLPRDTEAGIAAMDMTPLARLCLLHLQFARGATVDQLDPALRRWQPLFAAVAGPGGSDRLAVFHAYILEVTEMPAQRLAALMSTLLAPRAGDLVMSTADKLRAEGRLQGKAEGKAEGRAEGRAEQLLLLLRKRFGSEADSVVPRLQAATPQDLDRWALRILDARSLADVFADD